QTRSAGELTVGAVGLLVGLLVAALLYFPVHSLPYIGDWVLLPLFLILGYGFAVIAAKKHRGILRLVGVHVTEPGPDGAEPEPTTLVDTSAIIDGRIADIVRTGFLAGELVVPEFVLKELQQVADSADPLKRNRGRRGLEVVHDLRSETQVSTPDLDFPDLPEVDAKLLKLAKERAMRILTTDYNLNRLARIQDVVILNVNELANALKPAVLPGEQFDVRLIREGKEIDQGVGYLDDGTMVVVEGGREAIGDTVQVQVTSVLQSPSGKMIFTRIAQG
ncbi:MAG TPA: TRAM domain-containing protein, partial [Gaiellales bacterium]|nr:TRAM domain-containing protein [Gaiellales bacterium]